MYNLFDVDLKKINLYAHSSKQKECKKELFYEHCDRSLKYYDRLFSDFNLTQVFLNLLEDIDPEGEINKDRIHNLMREFVIFHDLGKLTKQFQNKLDGIKNKSTHSDKSFFIILYGLFKLCEKGKINQKEFFLLFCLLYSVYKHHGRLNNFLDDIQSFSSSKINTSDVELILRKYLKEDVDGNIIRIIQDDSFWQSWNKKQKKDLFKKISKDSLSFFILLKLFHSLLISSDYYATLEYETGKNFEFLSLNGNLSSEIKKRFHEQNNSEDFENFNVDINARREELLEKDINSLKNKDDMNFVLNEVRSILNVKAELELDKIISSSPSNNTFFLNVPTGGGKTNLSLRLALKIMEKEKINKLFYVFPFINLIEQTYDSLAKYISNDNMIRLDSRFVDETVQEEEGYDEKVFARHIDTLFFNKPVLFLSHVKFFDMFFRNDKNSNYNFYQLSNSVVIIDEIQAYNDEVWTEMSYIFRSISKFMNTKFIVMSATLPSMSRLANTKFNYVFDEKFTEDLFSHPAFDRVEIKTDNETKQIEDIPKRILKEKSNKILIVVNTVKDSYDLFCQIQDNNNFTEYERFLLNSTILSDMRKEILKKCKEAKEGKKIILIATQSVEAGVDIDFDFGIRDYSPLDSIVQVEGRINRNNSKDKSQLNVINTGSSSKVYRTGIKSNLSESIKDDFFKKEVFNSNVELKKFYDEIVNIHKKNNETAFIESSATNITDMSNLYLKIIDEKIHLIDGDTFSLFMPINDEAEYLWEEYIALFEDNRSYENLIKIKDAASKLSKYSINIFNSYTSKGKIKSILNDEIRFGYYRCDDWKEYYSEEKGLDPERFKSAVTGRQVLFI
ncbi:MAG: CRISPR-associated helicase Cas3' [Thermotogota bacterium]